MGPRMRAMLRAALALGLLLALGGQLDGLLPTQGRPRAYLAEPPGLPAWPEGAAEAPWPQDGTLACVAACRTRVPAQAEGDLWVSWDGARTAGFVAAVDGEAGRPAFDAVRLGPVQGGESLRLWGTGEAVLAVLAPVADRPNLVALAPAHLGAAAPGALASGCLAEEAGTRCLRFTTGVANNGDVPLRLASGPAGAGMVQDLPGKDHAAGVAAYHAAHGHFHYARFMAFGLHRVDAATGLRGEAVASTAKTGFCMVDWGPVADAQALPAKTFWRDGCEPHQRRLEMGVNPGWYDIYRWFLPEQAIDVAGLPDGTYELVATADPDGTLAEQHTLDNRASTVFTLHGGQVATLEERGLYRLRTAAA